MKPVLVIRPRRLNYLLSLTIFVLAMMILSAFVSIFLSRDFALGFAVTRGMASGLLLGGFLLWVFDENMQFERWPIVLTENAIIVPEAWLKRKIYLITGLDKQRTIAFNTNGSIRNNTRYTFWLINGDSFSIRKSFYGVSQLNELLEKIGLPKT